MVKNKRNVSSGMFRPLWTLVAILIVAAVWAFIERDISAGILFGSGAIILICGILFEDRKS